MAHALADAGEKIVVLDNLSTGIRALVPPGATFVEGNTGDAVLVRKLIAEHGIDAIIHFAASIVVPESVEQPLAYYENNTASTLRLLDAAIQSGVKHVVFSSTAAVYGDVDKDLISETDRLLPINPYGR